MATTVLDFQDTHVDARIVGVASRLPSVPADSGAFVLADAGWLSTAIDANAPGEGTPNEVWISAPGDGSVAGQTLHRPPFAGLVVDSRAAIERRLAGDPLAHATAIALGAAGLVALVLAVLGFWVGVASELHDEKSDFFDLEAQGLRARRHAPTAAHARGDPARGRLRRRAWRWPCCSRASSSR